jgi:hypothetical protein
MSMVTASNARRLAAIDASGNRVATSVLTLLAAAIVSGIPVIATADTGTREDCKTAYEQGQVARIAGRLHQASTLFRACSAPSCAAFMASDCAHWLDEVTAEMPTIVVAAHDSRGQDVSDARLFVDGALKATHLAGLAFDLDPGEHALRLEAAGASPIETKIVAHIGEKDRRVDLLLSTPFDSTAQPAAGGSKVETSPEGTPWITYALSGLAIAGLGTFAIFGGEGLLVAQNRNQTCAPNCTDAEVSPIRTDFQVADVGLGVGVVAGALAAYFFFRELGGRRAGSAWLVLPSDGVALGF